MVKAYLVHRRWREQAILGAIRNNIGSINGIVGLIYKDLNPKLTIAAALSVQAHVEHLMERDLVISDGPLQFASRLEATR